MRYQDLKIGIVGAGSTGIALAVLLASQGYNVELVNHKSKGICIGCAEVYNIYGDFGNISYLVPTVKSIEEFTSKKDFIICATKASTTMGYAKTLLKYLTKVGAIVTIQNTFCADRLLKLIPSDKSVCMYMDIYSKSFPQGVCSINSGGITLGVYSKDAFSKMKVLEHIFSSFCKVNITNNVFGFVLGRSILSGAIALLGAISGLPLGKILKDKKGIFLFNKIIEESMYLISKYRIKVLPYNDKLDYYKFIDKSFEGRKYNKQMIRILRKNNKYIRSSLLDAIEQNKNTDLEFLLGSMYDYSTRKKFKTPYINTIYAMVKEIEDGKKRICKNAFYDEAFDDIDDN